MVSTLGKVSLRNVAAHKLRLALTLVAVMLGTAFCRCADVYQHVVVDV